MENCFRDGELKTIGTNIEKIMPPISHFGGGKRKEKKQQVIEKLKTFFKTYIGIGKMPIFVKKEEAIVKIDSYNSILEKEALQVAENINYGVIDE